jgi:uncharacterized membrane protein YqiK
MRWLRLGCRAHRLAAGVARVGTDLLHQPLLAGVPGLLSVPARYRSIHSWANLVREGVLDAALVSGLEIQAAGALLDLGGLQWLELGSLPLALAIRRKNGGADSPFPPVLLPMRAITAGMDLIELHQSRASFVQKVQQTLNNDLSPNGLELESVALTKLDETPIGKLDENNTFDVTGLRVRAAIVSEQKKQRVSIEESAALEIARTLQANRIQKLEVERAEAEATQKQRIAVSELEATAAREAARIAEETERLREVARIERERGVRKATIEQEQTIQIAEQESKANVALQSEKQSRAEAQASIARAEAITAEEATNTARLTAIAQREKGIEITEAEKEAEKQATSIRVRARVEREAAEDQAMAITARARAEADAVKIAAEAEMEKGRAEAATIRAKVEAENALSPEVMEFKMRLAKIEALPAIIREMVEPARHIQSFRVNQITGVGASASQGTGPGDGAVGNEGIVDQVMAGMQRNAVVMPILTALGKEVGIDFTKGMDGIAASVEDVGESAPPAPSERKDGGRVSKAES